jgi:hypothetical protein
MRPKQPKRVHSHLLTGAERDAYLDAQWRPFSAFIGPLMPPMIAWQRAGEPGFPFHWDGGPLPGTINYVVGEQLTLFTDVDQ